MGASARLAGVRRAVGHDVRRQVTVAGVIATLALGLLLAVPGLQPVREQIVAMDPAWVLGAIALELASCVSFVVIYRLFFDRVAPAPARALAWTSMAAGVVLPAGGAGGLAVAGWLVRLMGHETGWIIRRSSALFVLTSAVNVVTLIAAGCVAIAGLGGPSDLLRAGLPLLAGCALIALAAVVALRSRAAHRDVEAATRRGELVVGVGEAGAVLVRPTWRVAGAAGYLWFDIAVLWATFNAIGSAPPLAALVLGYLIGYLANGLPVPGGIGVLDAGLAGALALYGVPALHAAAAVLVYHAVAAWVPGLGGLVAFAARQHRMHAGGGTR
ncbi:MAG TPA: lysylphosphatidylglycerol synthase domain-containing protein [Solirubrobacteraceae bacterium]|nr:lysylphosphatidylglycerol synthase domain-containing protein [Solirubrobacteraceae bacterium]